MTGRGIDEFWHLTPREVDWVLKAAQNTRRDSADLVSWAVWRLACLQRYKRLPRRPDELLKEKIAGSGGDWKVQKRMVEILNRMLGGTDDRKKGKK